jgi:hypothetical protein
MFDYLGIDKGIQDQKLLPLGREEMNILNLTHLLSPESDEQGLCHVIGWKGLM